MRRWIGFGLWLVLAFRAIGQDLSWLVEQSPTVTTTLAKALEKCPSFSAGVNLEVSSKGDPIPTSASGTLEFRNGSMRWQASLKDIKSGQLTDQAKAAVRQLNGDQLVLITRPDQSANYVVLPGAQACLLQELPEVKLTSRKLETLKETVQGHVCVRDQFMIVRPDGGTNALTVWRAKEFQNIPLQVEIRDSGTQFRFRLKDVHIGPVRAERFEVPAGLTKYSSLEDLIQSVMLDKFKRRLGIE